MTENAAPRRRGRPPIKTPEEMRDECVEAGMSLLANRGPSYGYGHVRLEEAIEGCSASRASIYRAWAAMDSDRPPQELFHEAMTLELLRTQPWGPTTVTVTDKVVRDTQERHELAELSPEERSALLRSLMRVGIAANAEESHQDLLWSSFVVAVTALISAPEGLPDVMVDGWRQGERLALDRYRTLYEDLARAFGFRLRYCYTMDQFATATAIVIEGIRLRSPASEHTGGIERATGADGEMETWSLDAVMFEALARQFFESDPDYPDIPTSLEHEADPATSP